MRRRLVSIWNRRGEIINMHGLSAAAERAGLTIAKILGTRAWGYNSTPSEILLRSKHAECLQDDRRVSFTADSEIDGVTEHWSIHMEPVGADPTVLCVATQVYPGIVLKFTQEQQRILRMLADDMDVPEIAERLKVSASAVRDRLTTLRKRFGVHTNHGLVAAAGRHGLLT